jgi:hypothetical protein
MVFEFVHPLLFIPKIHAQFTVVPPDRQIRVDANIVTLLLDKGN